MNTIDIFDITPGMGLLIPTNRGKCEFSKHVVVSTSKGHPGSRKVYCKHGFEFGEEHTFYLNNQINRTFLLLEPEHTIIDFDED